MNVSRQVNRGPNPSAAANGDGPVRLQSACPLVAVAELGQLDLQGDYGRAAPSASPLWFPLTVPSMIPVLRRTSHSCLSESAPDKVQGFSVRFSYRHFESCDVVFARKSTNRTVKHSALA
jgi:hypothetical protein